MTTNMNAWSNSACCGYAIMAMEADDFPPEEIQWMVALICEAMDFHGVEEAACYYEEGPY